jgi:hypothetical protein
MTLYALEPGVEPGEELDRPPAIPPMEHGGDYLADAVSLWRLVDDRRTDALREFLARAEAEAEAADEDDAYGHPRWDTAQVWELVDLLSGLEAALQDAGVIDAGWLISPDQAVDLARRVPGMDVRPERSEAELPHALAEVIARVRALRKFLTRAAEAGARVELS